MDLTRAEIKIAELLRAGKARKEIAATLGLSPRTVNTHLDNIYSKLNVHSASEFIALMRHEESDRLGALIAGELEEIRERLAHLEEAFDRMIDKLTSAHQLGAASR
jgi:DNA-binding CsgD family transcriptional regulator